ncbi:hypothetical protein JG688_00018083, partial [Phytophthora aleatoria]
PGKTYPRRTGNCAARKHAATSGATCSQTPEQQAAEVRLNSQRRQDMRGVMTPDEQALERERNTHGRHELRASQTVEQQILDREVNTQGRQVLRAATPPEEEAHARQRNTCSRRELRNALALEEQESEHRRQERVAQEEEAREAQREVVRIRRKCMRRGHDLYYHDRFAIARISGKNVRDGHHTLPEMYECIWCGAWKWPGATVAAHSANKTQNVAILIFLVTS